MSKILRPDYYQAGNFDVIAFCQQHGIGFCAGNAIKYLTRAGKKDPAKTIEDLEKAREYILREIRSIQEKEAQP